MNGCDGENSSVPQRLVSSDEVSNIASLKDLNDTIDEFVQARRTDTMISK